MKIYLFIFAAFLSAACLAQTKSRSPDVLIPNTTFAAPDKATVSHLIKNNNYSVETYKNEISKIDLKIYNSIAQSCLTETNCNFKILNNCKKIINNQRECIISINEIFYDNSLPSGFYIKTLDALKITVKQPVGIFDSDDIDCKPKTGLKKYTLVIGTWKWRKNPKGFGYVDKIFQSWVIDLNELKFNSINPELVVCELNQDRN
jgi:hypothetical protein